MSDVITQDNNIGTATGVYGVPAGLTEVRPARLTEVRPRLPEPISTRPTDTESETSQIEADPDLYARALDRLNRPGPTVPLSDVLSRLDEDQSGQ
jgi:hypothetical protein